VTNEMYEHLYVLAAGDRSSSSSESSESSTVTLPLGAKADETRILCIYTVPYRLKSSSVVR
jgi:hypothetical protein